MDRQRVGGKLDLREKLAFEAATMLRHFVADIFLIQFAKHIEFFPL